MRLVRYLLLALVLGVLFGGCGDSEPESQNAEDSPDGGRVFNAQEPAYEEQEVITALGLTGEGPGYDLGNEECVASVIMTTPGEIKVYADAGDTVATNDAGTVGIKVGTYQGGPSTAECARRFAKLLSERVP